MTHNATYDKENGYIFTDRNRQTDRQTLVTTERDS